MSWTTRKEPVNETTVLRKLVTFTVTPSVTPLPVNLTVGTVPLEIKILGVTVQYLVVGSSLGMASATPNVTPPTVFSMERTVSLN